MEWNVIESRMNILNFVWNQIENILQRILKTVLADVSELRMNYCINFEFSNNYCT